ncbi:hypothetical protein B4U80_13499, partial [Leptotrombidium deliense]
MLYNKTVNTITAIWLLPYLLFLQYIVVTISRVEFKVKVITWNVNEIFPVSDIDSLVKIQESPDFYAFTFQEVNPKACTLSKNDDDWISLISHYLWKNGYEIIERKSIKGSFTAVFARLSLMNEINHVKTSSKKTGHLGKVGNKGGTAVRFEYKNISLVFVGSHFHAHDDQLEARIKDYYDIIDSITFNEFEAEYINDHDFVSWSGDLNFRIDTLSAEQIVTITKN